MELIAENDRVKFVVTIELHFSRVETLYQQLAPARNGKNSRNGDWIIGSLDLENTAQELAGLNFPEMETHKHFDEVTKWGGGHRFRERARTINTPETVASAFRAAYKKATKGEVAEAVSVIANLKYVGQSFASKQIRILMPETAVTMDSVIRNRLGYRENKAGYKDFLRDCGTVFERIKISDEVPDNLKNKLRLCDVEMMIYQSAKGNG
ncbi:MAG: hypothetical protein WD470_00780 [Rhodospirillaceae bacterium]